MLKHIFSMAMGAFLMFTGCGEQAAQKKVVVYTAHDQIYSEPIFTAFEEKTGIKVEPVFDTEAVKSVGLVNRLISESSNPRCDVFWNNEIARTIVLKNKGLLQPYESNQTRRISSNYKDTEHTWTGFAARLRVIVYNTDQLEEKEAPHSIYDFLKPEWKGKLAIGYPLFGTTEIHFAALNLKMGEEVESFFRQMCENEVACLDGNAMVVSFVAQGTYMAGFTDTDDVYSAKQEGKSVDMIFHDQDGMGSLLIPNTVAMIKGAPHPEEAGALIDFLLSEEVQLMLARSPSAQIPIGQTVEFEHSAFKDLDIRVMDVDYEQVAEIMQENRDLLQSIFVR